jgi:hypothetical protein
MNLVMLSRKVPGKTFNSVTTTNEKGETITVNPTVEFEGVDLDNLPTVKELLELCGKEAALYLAKGFNDTQFDAARDPFDKYIPEDFNDEQAKNFRASMINMCRVLNQTPDFVATMLLKAIGRE